MKKDLESDTAEDDEEDGVSYQQAFHDKIGKVKHSIIVTQSPYHQCKTFRIL